MADVNPDLHARKVWAKPQLKRLDAGAAQANPAGQNGDGLGGQKRS